MTILIIKVMTLMVMALVNSEKSMYDSVIRMIMLVTVLMMMKKITFSTRYLFSLQIKRDLASGQLQVKIGAKFLT